MAEKKPKNIESELHKKAARPNTAPIVNKKTQQKKKKKKNPQADKKNLQKMEAQRFKSALSKITQGIVFSEKSIFQSVDVSSEVHTTKKSVTYTVMIQPVLKNNSIGHVRETILMYSKNWTVDMMKKEILDVLKRDSYDFIPDKETETDIKQRILDIIKSHPDVVVDKEFIPIYRLVLLTVFLACKCSDKQRYRKGRTNQAQAHKHGNQPKRGNQFPVLSVPVYLQERKDWNAEKLRPEASCKVY